MRRFEAARVFAIADAVRLVVDHRALLLERTDDAQYRELIDLIARWHVLYLAAGLQDSVWPDIDIFVLLADLLYLPWEDLEQRIARCVAKDGPAFVRFAAWAREHVPEYKFPDELLDGLTGKTDRRRLVKEKAERLRATIGVGTSRLN